ncbi:MAG: alpha/beta fold hydrolase [Thermoproteota archaeon]|nr:alpha/beta fold hydrolase [Thermoproteota archaeon]
MSQINAAAIFTIIIILISNSNSIFLLFVNDNSNNILAYAQVQSDVDHQGQRVTFLTDDGVSIVGTYYTPASGTNSSTPIVILLHMLGRDRNTWNTLASTLSQKEGYAVLSIDFRGHGESIKQNDKTISYQTFMEEDFNKMVLDVKAAKQFLTGQKNANPNTISIIGASIGANVALDYAASDPTIKSVVLLSPGINYRGVSTSEAITKFKNPIYIAATQGDSESAKDSQILCNMINCDGNIKIYSDNSSSHGTNMLSDQSLNPPLQDLILSWLKSSFYSSSSS